MSRKSRLSLVATLLVVAGLTLALPFQSLTILSSVLAQTPSVAKQNGASYDADIWTRGGAVILYPTNGNFQITGGGGAVSPVSTEAFGIRIKETKNGVNWFVRLTYVSATQINGVLAYDTQSGETPNSVITFQIEKTDGMGGWTNERSSFTHNVSNIDPRTYVVYDNDINSPTYGQPVLNGDIYVCDDTPCTSASFYKKVFDGNPNPSTYNSNPVFVIIYLTGTRASVAGNSVLFDGSTAGTVTGTATEVYDGTEQVNWQVPSSISSGVHDIKVVNASSGSAGNTAKIRFQ